MEVVTDRAPGWTEVGNTLGIGNVDAHTHFAIMMSSGVACMLVMSAAERRGRLETSHAASQFN